MRSSHLFPGFRQLIEAVVRYAIQAEKALDVSDVWNIVDMVVSVFQRQ